MNVLFTLDYGAPKSGNFIPSLLALADQIRSDGGNACFLVKKLDEGRCHWMTWVRTRGYELFALDGQKPLLPQLQALISDRNIDVIHDHFGCYAHFLVKHARSLRPARIIVHDHMGFNFHHKLRQWLRNLALSAVYRYHGAWLVAANREKSRSFALCRHWFVPNGLSPERYFDDPRRGEGREPGDNVWNTPPQPGEYRCLFLGWHPKFKGLDVAIRAVDLVRKRGMNMILCIIGFEHGMSREKQSFLESATGLSVHSDFIRYLKSEEDMFSVYRGMDVFLSASRVEAFSYALLEAISQNVPVVVSDIQGTRWTASYSKCFFYPTEDPEQCADALQKAVSVTRDPSNSAEIIEKYSVDNWVRAMMRIFKKGMR